MYLFTFVYRFFTFISLNGRLKHILTNTRLNRTLYKYMFYY